MTRIESQSVRLARLGFADVARAAELVESWATSGTAEQIDAALSALTEVPDPDLALAGFHQLTQIRPTLLGEGATDPEFLARLVAVLGSSVALKIGRASCRERV